MGWDTMIRPASELEMFHFSGLRGSLLKILKDENEQEKTISFNNQFLLKIFNKNFINFLRFCGKRTVHNENWLLYAWQKKKAA